MDYNEKEQAILVITLQTLALTLAMFAQCIVCISG